MVLTFDDGYENFFENAFPILQDYGYPSTVFAVFDFLGGTAKWLHGSAANSPLMSAATLRSFASVNVEIGSHTLTHPRLTRVPFHRRQAEIAASKTALEDMLGKPVDFFAYPYGDYNERVRDAVIAAGYRAAVTCSRGAAQAAPNAYEMPRKGISYGDNLVGYFWKVAVKNKLKQRYG